MKDKPGQAKLNGKDNKAVEALPESGAAADKTVMSIETESQLQEQEKTVITHSGSDLDNIKATQTKAEPTATIFAEKYVILEKLGSGGISTVYKSKHQLLEKTYALKLLQDVKQDTIMRFQQEAKAATLLKHPNLVGVVDFGIADAVPYMVMDFVDGITLSSFAKNKILSSATLCRLFGEICLGLAHAHERGVIHRDIKPSNIMITTDSEGIEHAIVVDFGIAKIIDDKSENSQNLTRTGDIFGTPLYMSPEQCQGAAVVDARSDIYSLACVMYELLAGKPPFQGDSSYQIIHQHISSAPPPLSNDLRKSKDTRMLEGIILKAMAKDPADRFQYMLQLSSALKEAELSTDQNNLDPLFQFKLALTRLKASDKESALRKAGLQAGIVLAVITALILFLSPQEISRTSEKIERETKILEFAKKLFGNAVATDENVFRLRPSIKKNIVEELSKLCSYDPQTAKASRRLKQKALQAINKLNGIMEFKKEMLEGGAGLNILSKMRKMEAHLSKGMTLWCQANAEAVDLANSVSAKRELNKDRLAGLNFVYYSALWLSLPLIITLFALLRTELEQKIKSKKSLPS